MFIVDHMGYKFHWFAVASGTEQNIDIE
jgi:hypothetical protein